MTLLSNTNYRLTSNKMWSGRADGAARSLMRWHQVVECVDLRICSNLQNSVVFIGFCSDEGVRRNQGRVGAKDAPEVFRKVLANMPIHFSETCRLLDAGDVYCEDADLENAQLALGQAVATVIKKGGFPIVLGGGHEVTYGHYLGVREVSKRQNIGVINLDAHLDIREPLDGKGNSGTGFFQIARDCEQDDVRFFYLPIGVNKMSNTQALFSLAESKGVKPIYQDSFSAERLPQVLDRIEAFANHVDHIYLTIDMDFFAAPYAPGVSALAYQGVAPDAVFQTVFSKIVNLPNLGSVDIAEFNPTYDIDNRTARLGATLLFELISQLHPSSDR